MIDKTPKIFISYAWSSQNRVVELANRLMSHGVEVVLDIWDLKEGQDKYAFMEQSVLDKEIDRVLLICDETYAEKANNREGGVGDETVIITPEVYGQVNQEKFIPVIFEVDGNLEAHRPAYLKSRIYIDLSTEDDRYESEYEKLLRNIFEKPLFKKPVLGKMPEWIENEKVDLSPIRDLIKQVRGYTGGNAAKADYLIRNALDAFVAALSAFRVGKLDDVSLLQKIDEMKPLRDLYFDFIEVLIYTGLPIVEIVTDFFEQVYNSTHDASGRGSYSDSDFEQYDFFIWESFIGTTAIMLHFEKYRDLYAVLSHTYFLRESYFSDNIKGVTFIHFRHYMKMIEENCKPKCDQPNLYTLAGQMLMQREKKPIITAASMSNADVTLYQLYAIYELNSDKWGNYWFPDTYIYCKQQPQWVKLISRRHCENILPLFGVTKIDEMKNKIAKLKPDKEMHYLHCFESAPTIERFIKIDEIASAN